MPCGLPSVLVGHRLLCERSSSTSLSLSRELKLNMTHSIANSTVPPLFKDSLCGSELETPHHPCFVSPACVPPQNAYWPTGSCDAVETKILSFCSLPFFSRSLAVSLPDEFDAYIIVSFVNATLVLSIGETVEEVTDSGFLGTTPTLSCSLLGEDALVQVSCAQPEGEVGWGAGFMETCR